MRHPCTKYISRAYTSNAKAREKVTSGETSESAREEKFMRLCGLAVKETVESKARKRAFRKKVARSVSCHNSEIHRDTGMVASQEG